MGAATPSDVALTILETDEIDTPLATYVYSESTIAERRDAEQSENKRRVRKGRLDIVMTRVIEQQQKAKLSACQEISNISSRASPWRSWGFSSVLSSLVNVFLPAGYPHSVSEDYLEYQIYDSIQAFSSSIAGLLSSRAVLQGVGVGDAAASPTSALLLHILQDSSGRIATILFAHRLGMSLEPECKMYRLAADVFNDAAMVLDSLSPLIGPRLARVAVLSGAGVLRALCGVSGGSSKASLSAHFAKWGNIGELNAKDSSQETIISLLGMLVGSFVVSYVTSPVATWIWLIVLLCVHLGTNYRAVRAVQMTSLNRQRANIVFSTLLNTDPDLHNLIEEGSGSVKSSASRFQKQKTLHTSEKLQSLRPSEVAVRERIFERDGILRWWSSPPSSSSSSSAFVSRPQKLGFCRIGCSPRELASCMDSDIIPRLISIFQNEHYLLAPAAAAATVNNLEKKRKGNIQIIIILKTGCTTTVQLKAWAHALLVAYLLDNNNNHNNIFSKPKANLDSNPDAPSVLSIISSTLSFLNQNLRFEKYMTGLTEVGWDLNVAALETSPGRRAQIVNPNSPDIGIRSD